MLKTRLFLFRSGFGIASMGIELMVKGLLSPRWCYRDGYSVEPTDAGFVIDYAAPSTPESEASQNDFSKTTGR